MYVYSFSHFLKGLSTLGGQKLDVITNDLLKRALRFTGRLGVLASEEEDEPVSVRGVRCGSLVIIKIIHGPFFSFLFRSI
jgi:fructose-1,6-bisphosphatase